MSKGYRPAPKSSNQILDEATTWFVELNADLQSHSKRVAFNYWLRRSPEHIRAYLHITALCEEAFLQPRNPVETIDELVALAKAEGNVLSMLQNPAMRPGAEDRGEKFELHRSSCQEAPGALHRSVAAGPVAWCALAACLTLVVSGASMYLQRGVYRTEVGELQSLTLSDGSTIELNSRSRIKVDYTSSERHIDLLDGQALFNVAKSTTRPFIVQTGLTQVRALGTQFDVYRKNTGTVVTVVEGRVAVSGAGSEGKAASEAVNLLAAGEQVTLTRAGAAQLRAANVDAATAWTHHHFVFSGTPLSEVAEEFNRYNPVPLVITDPALAPTEISGSFSVNDPMALVHFLREVGPYTVRETSSAIEISQN